MSGKIEKRPGPDWEIHYMYLDGSRDCMAVFGAATPEEAIAEARFSLNATCETIEEEDQFEILAVVRCGAGVDVSVKG
jgi:hypothetical protein